MTKIRLMAKASNFRKTQEYGILGETFKFKTDKNYSVFEVSPRIYCIGDKQHDVLSVVRGQVPFKAANSLEQAILKWQADYERYS